MKKFPEATLESRTAEYAELIADYTVQELVKENNRFKVPYKTRLTRKDLIKNVSRYLAQAETEWEPIFSPEISRELTRLILNIK